jgi:hypothetical protein
MDSLVQQTMGLLLDNEPEFIEQLGFQVPSAILSITQHSVFQQERGLA